MSCGRHRYRPRFWVGIGMLGALVCLECCHKIFPYPPAEREAKSLDDGRVVIDVSQHGDRLTYERGLGDASFDRAAPRDRWTNEYTTALDGDMQDAAASDLFSADYPTIQDVSPDKALDVTVVRDLEVAVDGAGISCSPGWLTNTIVCKQPAGDGMDQCTAEFSCSPGSHMCTATEYLNRGGDQSPAPDDYWLASCVRLSGEPFPPTDATCGGGCVLVTNQNAGAASWYCLNGASFSILANNTGIKTDSKCHRLGVDSSDNQGFWKIGGEYTNASGVLCCY